MLKKIKIKQKPSVNSEPFCKPNYLLMNPENDQNNGLSAQQTFWHVAAGKTQIGKTATACIFCTISVKHQQLVLYIYIILYYFIYIYTHREKWSISVNSPMFLLSLYMILESYLQCPTELHQPNVTRCWVPAVRTRCNQNVAINHSVSFLL